jgi:hypothetical protein
MDLQVQFANNPQREFYYAVERNQCFSGGFNNGKTWSACFKAICLLLTFPGYRVLIARQKFTDLKKTTMQTFFKFLPGELILSHNEQDGVTHLLNGSTVFWMHLDHVEESTLRGLEVNMVLVDQAEEMEEKTYDVLDARIGRWKGAVVPEYLLLKFKDWPRDRFGQPEVPSYHCLLCNPDSLFHFIYRKYHKESRERQQDHFFVEGEWDSSLGSEESYEQALRRDKDYVDRFVRGKWGLSEAQIHIIREPSLLDYDEDFVKTILSKGNLFRVLDHGSSAPTCCLWVCSYKGVYIFYREYYAANRLISQHRKAIHELSNGEEYSNNWADPSIDHKASQKEGGFWSVADEYRTDDIEGPPLIFNAADNNEFATRNRINELLTISDRFKHPITQESPSPGIYFIKASRGYPYGCVEAIKQLGGQRKEFLGTIDGKNVYSDERDDSIPDHAYDPVRYFVSMHPWQKQEPPRSAPARSFARFNKLIKRYQGLVAASN